MKIEFESSALSLLDTDVASRPLYAIQLSDLSFETGKKAFNLIGRGQRSLLPIHISYRIHNKSETHVK